MAFSLRAVLLLSTISLAVCSSAIRDESGNDATQSLVYSNRTQQGKQFVGFNLFMNFLDFIEHCHKNNLEPAEVRSREENEVLTAYLDGNFADPKYFWLGGMDVGREGRYYWIASLSEFNYTSWYTGYPNGGRDENCATIYGGDGSWYDQYCTNDGVQPLCQRTE